jgi:hypothetical protein
MQTNQIPNQHFARSTNFWPNVKENATYLQTTTFCEAVQYLMEVKARPSLLVSSVVIVRATQLQSLAAECIVWRRSALFGGAVQGVTEAGLQIG